MINVEITMEKSVTEEPEVKACVIQLGNDRYDQSISCNISYATKTQSGEPQKIIVSL